MGPETELQERRRRDGHHLNLSDLAKGYLRQAEARLKDARDALVEGNYPYALRLSQECVELCVKAALRLVAIEYPKLHEVSDLLIEFKDRFPEWFRAEIASTHEASVSLFRKRELALYGGEDMALPPDKVIAEEDGRKAVESAERVYSDCARLLKETAPDRSPTSRSSAQ